MRTEKAYEVAVADLRRQRAHLRAELDEIDDLITKLTRRVSSIATDGPTQQSLTRPSGTPTRLPESNEYASMKAGEAALTYLREVASAEPLSTRQIVNALERGGFALKTGKDPYGAVSAALSRVAESEPHVLKKVGASWLFVAHRGGPPRTESSDGPGYIRDQTREPDRRELD